MRYHPVHKLHPRQRGFTLIELIVVLVILGILAAFAIPRFVGVNTDARKASVAGLAGSLRSSSALVHGLALARGLTGATGTIDLEGQTVTLANGYPTADAPGIGASVLNLDGYTATPGTGTISYNPKSQPAPALCTVTYTAAPATNTSAVVSQVDSGC